jgi:hypothetical protein
MKIRLSHPARFRSRFRAVRACRRSLLGGVLVTCLLGVSTGTTWATDATLSGGEGSSWVASDQVTTTNGLPTNGSCSSGPGDGIIDAGLPGQSDAFDDAALVHVQGLGSAFPDQVDGAGAFSANEAIYAPVAYDSFTVSIKQFALSTQAILRTLVRIENPGEVEVPALVYYTNNFGSNSSTQFDATSSGDNFYNFEDRWVVTSDGDPPSDPVNTSVFHGPGTPQEQTAFSDGNVFECTGTEGSQNIFHLEIPPGGVETLMLFQQLNPTVADAVAEAVQYDTTPALGSPLTEGMTQAEYSSVVNWDVGFTSAECDDGIDNDGDGRIDHPADRQCESPADRSERPQCGDELDNDGDRNIDYPADPGCSSARDNSESPNPQCSNEADDDSDGALDMADPGCSSPRDNNETNAACADTLDNDGDQRTDYPTDPGCNSRTDNSESPDPQCGDRIDNDGDGKVDFGADPGCGSIRDNGESPDLQCGDRIDNDGDGLIDHGSDPGCRSPRDNSE